MIAINTSVLLDLPGILATRSAFLRWIGSLCFRSTFWEESQVCKGLQIFGRAIRAAKRSRCIAFQLQRRAQLCRNLRLYTISSL